MGLRKLLGLERPADKQNIRFKRSYTNSVAGTRAFLHIGKTGGSGVGDLIRKLRAQGYDTPGRLDHQTTLESVIRKHPRAKISIIVRDPLERMISGFNSRLRQGRPRYQNNIWTSDEATSFAIFRDAESFLRALISDDEFQRSASAFARASIVHVARGYVFHFRSVEFVAANRNRFYHVGHIDDMRGALAGIFEPIPAAKLDEFYEMTHVSAVKPSSVLNLFSEDELRRLHETLAEEYAIYDYLRGMVPPSVEASPH